MARKKIIAGNWKMNKTPSEAVALVEELKPLVSNEEVDVVFCVQAATSRLVLRICILRKAEHTQEKFPRICW